MYCGKCGKRLFDDARFCFNCGMPVYSPSNKKESGGEKSVIINNINNNATVSIDISTLSGTEFEKLCSNLLVKMGFTVEATKASGDGGIDLIAWNNEPMRKGKYIIQCKRYSGNVGEPILRDLYGVVMSERANKGILITTGSFTASAIRFSENKQIEIIDGSMLNNLLMSYGLLRKKHSNNISIGLIYKNDLDYMYSDFCNYINKLAIHENSEIRSSFILFLLKDYSIEIPFRSYEYEQAFINGIREEMRIFIETNKGKDTRSLKLIYMASYIQLSILVGEFYEARIMFEKYMQHDELQLTKAELWSAKKTKLIFAENALFYALYYTCFNMMQLAIITNDRVLKYKLQKEEVYITIVDTMKDIWTRSRKEQSERGGTTSHYTEELNHLQRVFVKKGTTQPELIKLYVFDWPEIEWYHKATYDFKDPPSHYVTDSLAV